jgi:hypothetical protein
LLIGLLVLLTAGAFAVFVYLVVKVIVLMLMLPLAMMEDDRHARFMSEQQAYWDQAERTRNESYRKIYWEMERNDE